MTIPGTYSQRDSRWADIPLGYSTNTIGNYGCLVTAIANMLWYMGHPDMNPAVVNQRLKANNGFVSGDLVVWATVPTLAPDIRVHGTSALVDANSFVAAEGNFVIMQVHKPGFPMHFVLLVEVNRIVDSWDGQVKYLSSSGYTVDACHLYGDISPDFTTGSQPTRAPQPQAPTNPKGEDVIPDTDNYYYRWGQKTAGFIRGRQLSRAEFSKYIAGKEPTAALETLEDNPEADTAFQALTLGQQAMKENWQGQITTLQGELTDLSNKDSALLADAKQQLDAANATIQKQATALKTAVTAQPLDSATLADLTRALGRKVFAWLQSSK